MFAMMAMVNAFRSIDFYILEAFLLFSSISPTSHYRLIGDFILSSEQSTSDYNIYQYSLAKIDQVLTGKSTLACQEAHRPIPCPLAEELHSGTPCTQHQ
jgi:hypothetical protein